MHAAPPTPYATAAHFATLGCPPDVAALAETLAPGCVQGNLDASNARIDGAVAQGATLPLSSWGPDLTELSCALAQFNVLLVKGYDPTNDADRAALLRYQMAGVRALIEPDGGATEPAPEHPPRAYLERLFDDYAASFDAHLQRHAG